MSLRRVVGALVVGSVALAATSARADPSFPQAVIDHLNITCSNPRWDGNGCMICHRDNNGLCGTVVHPFGQWLYAKGLTCHSIDIGLLDSLLDEAADAGIDTNCDGVPDIQQLASCQWQTLATVDMCVDAGGDGGLVESTPAITNVTYGCSSTPGTPAMPAVGVSAVLLGLLLRHRRRPRSVRRGGTT
jgi:MYXO-CTERM domain-containing protein